jgi:hypothetical protein
MQNTLNVGIAFVLAGLVASSCNTLYEEPDAASPTAIVEFSRVEDPKDLSGSAGWLDTRYDIAQNEACEARARVAATGLGAHEPRRRLPADKPVILIATTPFPDLGAGSDLRSTGCLALVRFTPRAGHSYAIGGEVQNNGGVVCEMKVVDEATKESPSDLLIDNRFHCPGR